MSYQNHQPPLGLLLQNAGLITEKQLQKALETQAKYTRMKLGEILVLQEGLQAKTIDFFVEQWHKLIDVGQQFPIGYYFKKASLLNEQQIKIILEEQKDNQQKFGAIAVQKGWLRPSTVDFFLKSLSFKQPQNLTFSSLEEYDREVLHLTQKYAHHSLILSRILAWSGGNSILSKTICHVFAQSQFKIAPGSEISAVDRFIEGTLIERWQTSKFASYIRSIQQSLVKNQKCSPILLLQEYRTILLAGSKEYRFSKEQDELLLLGLIARDREKLRVANLIFQRVFNQNWTTRELKRLKSNEANSNRVATSAQDLSTSLTVIEPQSIDSKADTASANHNSHNSHNSQNTNSPDPLTKIGSLITLAAIALLIPLFLTIDNYYSSRSQPEPLAVDSLSENDLQQFCSEIDLSDSSSSLKLISILENSQQELNVFPPNCETALNRLRVLAAPQLGRENRVLEAVRHLCRVSSDSEVYLDAEVWLKRWYESPDWGEEIAFYLEEFSEYNGFDCPAAHFIEYESS